MRINPRSVVLASLLAVGAIPLAAQQSQSPTLSLQQIIRLLKADIAKERILDRARTDCIESSVVAGETQLRAAGATSQFLEALRKIDTDCREKAAQEELLRKGPPPLPPGLNGNSTTGTTATAGTADTGPTNRIGDPVPVTFTAGIVGPDGGVRYLPGVSLAVVNAQTGRDTTRVTTNLSGKANALLPQAQYRVVAATRLENEKEIVEYDWAVDFSVPGTGPVEVELTKTNASAARRTVKDTRSPEQRIMEQYQHGVFTVYGGAGTGAGFLVDSTATAAILVTSADIVGFVDSVRVQVDSATKLQGRLLATDLANNLAAVAVSRRGCRKCVALPLAAPGTKMPGMNESILGLGTVLRRDPRKLYRLQAINADERRVTLDRRLEDGDLGSPVLDLDGRVIGAATSELIQYGINVPRADRVPVPGAGVVRDLLKVARAKLDSIKPVLRDSTLPLPHPFPFPEATIAQMKADGVAFDPKPYILSVGSYKVMILTPPVAAWRQAEAKREKTKRGMSDAERIDPIELWSGWEDHIAERRPVVIFSITPRQTDFPFYEKDKNPSVESELISVQLLRNGKAVTPVEMANLPAVVNGYKLRKDNKAVASQVVYVYRLSEFQVRPGATRPTLSLEILDSNGMPISLPLSNKVVDGIVKDFEPWTAAIIEQAR